MDSFFLDNLSLLFLQKVATWSKVIPPFNASTVLFFRSFEGLSLEMSSAGNHLSSFSKTPVGYRRADCTLFLMSAAAAAGPVIQGRNSFVASGDVTRGQNPHRTMTKYYYHTMTKR